MKVMGVNLSHDGSVCVIDDGVVVYYQEEERLTHEKHTTGFVNAFSEALRLFDPENIVLVGALPYDLDAEAVVSSLMLAAGRLKHFTEHDKKNVVWMKDHHLAHALLAYRNSGFEDPAVLVVDGAGQAFVDEDYLYREAETVYDSVDGSPVAIHKKLITQMGMEDYLDKAGEEFEDRPYFSVCDSPLPSHSVDFYSSDMSIGKMFSRTGMQIFGGYHNAGKVMGLSAYGKDDESHPRAFEANQPNPELLYSDTTDEDIAYRVQHDSLEVSKKLIKLVQSLTNKKQICLSGGYFLNCVNNYKYLKSFPDVEFYVEPNSADSGTAIGAAMWGYENITGQKAFPVSDIYLGRQADYAFDPSEVKEVLKCVPSYVAGKLASGEVVAIFQGKEESGPRALGHRSILYDPRDPNGRDKVNLIKKRESFRPFAGSVLQEKARDWFDLAEMEESAHMMYAVETLPDKAELVPALQHNDGTSRIQTVSADNDMHYHKLIKEFDKITGVPMLLNTSFNLAGDTLVVDLKDAIRTCKESGIKFLYLPERKQIIVV